jgi:hypothetical protein
MFLEDCSPGQHAPASQLQLHKPKNKHPIYHHGNYFHSFLCELPSLINCFELHKTCRYCNQSLLLIEWQNKEIDKRNLNYRTSDDTCRHRVMRRGHSSSRMTNAAHWLPHPKDEARRMRGNRHSMDIQELDYLALPVAHLSFTRLYNFTNGKQ